MNDLHSLHYIDALNDVPLIAILRGIEPGEIEAVASALVSSGFRFIEVPLNSPDPWRSIEILRACCPETIIVGAGTVLTVESVKRIAKLGATMVVTPNSDPSVISATQSAGLTSFTGFTTVTEAFSAIAAGATALKLFPAARMGLDYFGDIKAVLPSDVPVFAVGGVDEDSMVQWYQTGIHGFGFGSNLYKPGQSANQVKQSATRLVAKWRLLEARR